MTETLRITNLRLRVEEPEHVLKDAVARKVRVSDSDLQRFRILRRSLDARKPDRLEFVYSVAFDVPDGAATDRVLSNSNIDRFDASHFEDPSPGSQPMSERPIVIGSGPAGLLAGSYLAERGYRPLIIERGQPVKERVPEIRSFDRGGDFAQENNYLFGEGGAGCFSDGKLTCRITGPDVDWVLKRFVDCGGRESLVYEHRPHLGSNKLPMICRNFRRKIEAMGGEYMFGCRFEGFQIEDGQVCGINTSSGELKSRHVILAIGHSARDTYEMMHASGIPMEPKAFQLGVRIEHPQENINKFKYGKDEYLTLLGAADYSIVAKGERDLFSFCMCAGGIVMP
ncbi:MAG: NAD(P)/FAD-dependent oxidoreductase, partial [Planctomycetaceae bacterium]